jgi:Tfp pilus assembly protein PilN
VSFSTGSDFLGEETRKQRRNLDIVAVLSALVVVLNLVPNRISAVGVDFGETKKQNFLILLLIFDLWFVVIFAIYAASDLVRIHMSLEQEGREAQLLQEQEEPRTELIRDRLMKAREAPDEEVPQIAADILAQINQLSLERLRQRSYETVHRIGRLRVVVDIFLPVVLGIAAAVLLIVKLLA